MKTSAATTSARPATGGPPVVLDPGTLGRPMHLLGGFTSALKSALAESFRTGLNRRHGAGYRVDDVGLGRHAAVPPGRWFATETPVGRIAFAMDRALLLSVLDYRYGAPVRAAADTPAIDSCARRPPKSAWPPRCARDGPKHSSAALILRQRMN